MSNKIPSVSIIILNWNEGAMTAACVKSILKNIDYKNFRIVIVDNGSTNSSLDEIRQNCKNTTLISLKQNHGYSKGMNVGALHALNNHESKYIIFLNNDIVIPASQKDWLTSLIKDLENDPSAAAASPRTEYPDGRPAYGGANLCRSIIARIFKKLNSRKKHYVEYGGGACIVAKTEVLQKIGLFDERFTPFWFEDVDLSLRMQKAGYKIIYNPEACVIHADSVSIEKYKNEAGQNKLRQINKKNFIRYAYKHYPFYLFLLTAITNLFITQIIYKENDKFVARFNPTTMLDLLGQLDLRKEKVYLSNWEAKKRIKSIEEL